MRGLILPTTVSETCWCLGPFQTRAFEFKICCEHPAVTSWLLFPHGGGGADGGHLLAEGPSRSELSPSKLCPSPSLGSSCWGPHASAKNDGHPWGLAESSARNRHRHSTSGKHIFRHLPENHNCFALREESEGILLKCYFCLVRCHFSGWHIHR